MRVWGKRALLAGIAVFVIAQLIPTTRANPPADPTQAVFTLRPLAMVRDAHIVAVILVLVGVALGARAGARYRANGPRRRERLSEYHGSLGLRPALEDVGEGTRGSQFGITQNDLGTRMRLAQLKPAAGKQVEALQVCPKAPGRATVSARFTLETRRRQLVQAVWNFPAFYEKDAWRFDLNEFLKLLNYQNY